MGILESGLCNICRVIGDKPCHIVSGTAFAVYMKKNYYKLFSKRMIISYIISLLLLFVGGWDCLYGISIGGNYSGTFIEIYLISMAHGTASLIAILFPIIGSFPGAGIYREEKDSGFLFYKIIKMNRTAYRIEKLMFTFLSGFLALFLPCLTWLLICFLFLNKGNTTFPLIYGLTFSEKLFNQHPFLYGCKRQVLSINFWQLISATFWQIKSSTFIYIPRIAPWEYFLVLI